MTRQYVVVEGVLGAGKTSLAQNLAEAWQAVFIQEDTAANPFLEDFYRDRRRFAFQTQITFLLNRYRQQEQLLQRDIFSPRVVSDYLFQKDRIFANVNLNEKELTLYESLFPLLNRDVPQPDLVVYLQSTPDALLEHIAERGRPFEKDMDSDYIRALTEAYNYFFFHYEATPLLVVDTSDVDLVDNPAACRDLMDRIEEHPGGTVYYRPLVEGD